MFVYSLIAHHHIYATWWQT